MKRALKLGAAGVGTLLVLVLAVIAWVLWTQSGTRFAVSQARAWLPAGMSVGDVHGRLGDAVDLRNLVIEDPSADITIGRVSLAWTPAKLLGGTLHVDTLEVADVRYRTNPDAPPPPDEGPFELPRRIELPVAVVLGELAVRRVALVTDPEAEPVRITSLTAQEVRFAQAQLNVGALAVDAPAGSAQGQVAATLADEYPVDVHVRWHLQPPGYAPLDGTTEATGNLAALRFEQRIDPPYALYASGTLSHLLSSDQVLAVDAALEVGELELSRVQQQWPQVTVSLDTTVRGPIDGLDIQANARATDPQQRRFLADLRAHLDQQMLRVERLQLRQPDHAGRLVGQGDVALAGDVAADLTIRWTSLSWPLTGEPTVRSPDGRLTVSGPLDDYQLELEARLAGDESLPSVDLNVTGRGTDQSMGADLVARSSAGDLTGRADVAWAPELRGEVTARADSLDPSVLVSGWPGRVNGRLSASGRITDQGMQVTVNRLDADGTLREMPLSVSAGAGFEQRGEQQRLRVDALEARLGPTRLDVRGEVAEVADITWELASDDLASLGMGLRGSVHGSGGVTGSIPRVHIAGGLQGRNLGFEAHDVERVALDADVDLSGAASSRLMLSAGPGTVAGIAVSGLTLDATGTPGEHRLKLALESEPVTGNLQFAGRLDDPWGANPVWNYTLSRGDLRYRDLQGWRLARPASGRVAATAQQLEEQCWQSSAASLCFGAHRNPREMAGTLKLENLAFDYFAALLPDGLSLDGALHADARATWPSDGVPTAQAEARTSAGAVRLAAAPELDRPATELALEPSRLTLALDEKRAQGRLSLNTGHGQIQAEAGTTAALVAGGTGADSQRASAEQPVTGRLRLEVPDLAFLSGLLPQVERVAGRIDGDMRIDGTLGNPGLSGTLGLTEGAVTVPEPGLDITGIRAAVTGAGRDGLAVRASATSGGGNLNIDGRLSPPGMPPTAHLDVTGNGFQVMNNAEARLFLSPDLQVAADERRVEVTGEVTVPKAEITPGSPSPTAVGASEDQVLVSREPQDATTQRQLLAEIRLILGDDVSIKGFGLTAGLDGNVLVQQQPEKPVTATGEIQLLDGEYRAYGQGLVIEEGRIYFAGGPITEPALDVRAVRRPEEGILVGAHVQGTLEAPTFELFSEPGMSQQEQLSYLVLGRSMEDAPEGQSSALNRAMLAMGLKGGDFLAKNLGQRLGVDEVGIRSGSGEAGSPSDPDEAALVVGKYLSPRLYVSYGLGLFNPESVLRMQYEIASNWRLVTESSSDATGADLLYSVELGGN